MTLHYDVIPDIHADIGRLTQTLWALGYVADRETLTHPEGRVAAFLGDFINKGRSNRSVLKLIRSMCEARSAVAIMGNHELNALLYHQRGQNADGSNDGYMRAHSIKNKAKHQTFLDEYLIGHFDTVDALDWFLTLPLFLDLGGLRLVHACWDDVRVATILERRSNGLLAAEDLQELALEGTENRFVEAVLTTVRGLQAEFPAKCSFYDIKGRECSKLQLKWWQSDVTNWRDAALFVCNTESVPAIPIGGDVAFRAYASEAKPVFFGHYKRLGTPTIDAPNAVCLDYPRVTCAYRWAGEARLDPQNLVVID